MAETIMVMDCNGVAHAVKYATANLSFRGRRTGVLYGFMMKLLKLQEAIRATQWVFAWDSPNGYLRKQAYPEYKANRSEKTPQEQRLDDIAKPQFTQLRKEVLSDLGFANVFCMTGFESDDIMARIAVCYVDAQVVLVTRDKDMYQCLSERVHIYDPVKEQYYKLSDLRGQWGCAPQDWGGAMCIAGCSTDNVAGVAGVGMKTAIKAMLGQLNAKSKAMTDIEAGADTIQRNFDLVALPHAQTPPCLLSAANRPTVGRMLAVAYKFGMKSLATEQFKSRWELAFERTS